MFILIDNYDSFTWNLWHFLSDLGAEVNIIRNDTCTPADIISAAPKGVIISPGPGIPKDAGISIDLIKACYNNQKPLLGVCLGHQALAAAFGGQIRRIDPPVHGKLSKIVKTNSAAVKSDIFSRCPDQFPVTRYHSLTVDELTLPKELIITARTEAGAIMGISHSDAELHGVQFHPESIASVAGYRILAKFLEICDHQVVSDNRIQQLESQILRLDERFPGQMHA